MCRYGPSSPADDPAPWSRAAACLAVLGGELVGVVAGAHVRYRCGDDATVLLTDPVAKVAVIALWAAPRTPTRVPLAEVVWHPCKGL